MFQRITFRILLILGCLCYVQSGFGQEDFLSPEIAPVRRLAEKVPVVPFYYTLFYVNSNIGSFSAEERAVSIAEKICTVKIRVFVH